MAASVYAVGLRPGPDFADPGRATAFAVVCAAITLILGIAWAARSRHFVGPIDGSRPPTGSPLDLTLRYVSNKTEQMELFIADCLVLHLADPERAHVLLPVAGSWFVVARIAF